MDETDKRIIQGLRRNGRIGISALAADLGLTRTTVRHRIDRLENSGAIAGYSVLTRDDVAPHPVRGLMMLFIEGRGTEKVARHLSRLPQVQAVHSTNGSWDLIAEIGTDTLENFDKTLTGIRKLDGITRSETNLLLSTKR